MKRPNQRDGEVEEGGGLEGPQDSVPWPLNIVSQYWEGLAPSHKVCNQVVDDAVLERFASMRLPGVVSVAQERFSLQGRFQLDLRAEFGVLKPAADHPGDACCGDYGVRMWRIP